MILVSLLIYYVSIIIVSDHYYVLVCLCWYLSLKILFPIYKILGKQKVRFPEFLKMMAEQHKKNLNSEREILAAFTALDRNKTGVVSRKQLQHLMTGTGDKLTPAECKRFDKGLAKMIHNGSYLQCNRFSFPLGVMCS